MLKKLFKKNDLEVGEVLSVKNTTVIINNLDEKLVDAFDELFHINKFSPFVLSEVGKSGVRLISTMNPKVSVELTKCDFDNLFEKGLISNWGTSWLAHLAHEGTILDDDFYNHFNTFRAEAILRSEGINLLRVLKLFADDEVYENDVYKTVETYYNDEGDSTTKTTLNISIKNNKRLIITDAHACIGVQVFDLATMEFTSPKQFAVCSSVDSYNFALGLALAVGRIKLNNLNAEDCGFLQ